MTITLVRRSATFRNKFRRWFFEGLRKNPHSTPALTPLVKGAPRDSHEQPVGRIRHTRNLLMTAALVVAVCLLITAMITTLLTPSPLVAHGSEANGRALDVLAHRDIGDPFGTIYDISTILSLWFADVSAMARLLNLHIASFFIGTVLIVSLISRSLRSLELRINDVRLDDTAKMFIHEAIQKTGQICLLARRPDNSDYEIKVAEMRELHKLTEDEATFIFLEVDIGDPSEFSDECLDVSGEERDGFKVLRCQSRAIPNAIAAILFHLRDKTKTIPHVYFGWTEGHPLAFVFKYIFLGEGETAPVTQDILREIEPNPARRPRIFVG